MSNKNSQARHKCPYCGENYRKQDFHVCPHCGAGEGNRTLKTWKPTKHQKKSFREKIKTLNN